MLEDGQVKDLGVPETLKSDRGPPFSSSGFAAMCKQFRIQHVISSPYNPRSNGHSEASVREAKRLVVQHKYQTAELDLGEMICMSV